MRYFLFVICIWIIGCLKANASVFPLNEDIIGISQMKTECITNSSQKDDYCKTQIAYQLTLYSGGQFGQITLALWGGTSEYASPNGACHLEFNRYTALGLKSYIPNSNFTACFIKDEDAVRVLAAMTDETRFDYYEPKYKGKNRNQNFYTSDLKLGFFSDRSIDENIVIAGYIHHLAISSKRTSYKDAYFGHTIVGASSPWTFGKILAKFKYYDLIN